MTTQQEQISALHKTIKSLRAQKRDQAQTIERLKKVSPLALEVATISYSGGSFDSLNLASQVLTSISWDDYPSASFDELIEKVEKLSPDLANEIRANGLEYRILWDDTTKDSGFKVEGMALDTEGWYDDLDSELINELRDDDELWDGVTDAIVGFDACNELMAILECKGISIEEVDALIK